MKKLYYIGGALAVLYVFISAIKDQWNPLKWFSSSAGNQTPPAHAAGTGCITNDGRQGIYDASGICVATGGGTPPAGQRAGSVYLIPAGSYFIGKTRVKCYSRTPGTICQSRIFDSQLGWGSLYSYTSTQCCYFF